MITPPLFRYAFRYYDGPTSTWMYYAILGGVVDVTTGPEWLSQSPKEWAEEGASFERDFETLGMFITSGTPITWTGEPARILRHIFLTQGTEGNCDLYIEMFNKDKSVWTYEPYLPDNFSLDFNTFNSDYDWVSIAAIEGGFAAKLKTRFDTEYEIEVEANPDVVYVKNDGIELQAKLNWAGIPNQDLNGYYNPEIFYIDTEGTNITLSPISQSVTGGAVRFVENTRGITQDIEIEYEYDVDLNIYGSVLHDSHFWIQLREVEISTNTLITTSYILNSAYSHPPGTTHNYKDTVKISYTLATDRRLEITYRVWEYVAAVFLICDGSGSAGDYQLISNKINLSVYLINRFETTYHPVLPAIKVFESLVTQINDYVYNIPSVYSDLISTTLNGEIYITCGDAVRGLAGSVMKISMSKFYSLFKGFNAALYYNSDLGRVYINDASYVFKNSLNSSLPSLGKAKSCRILPFSSQSFNNLIIGGGTYNYDAQKNTDIEITNGKDEINLSSKYLSALSKTKKDINFESGIRYDCHGLEQVRINFTGKTISESSSDNDLFAMHLTQDPSGTFDLNGVTTDYVDIIRTPINLTPGASFFNIENIFSPESVYNVIFFPVKSLFRCGTWFRSLLKFNDATYLKIQSTAKNTANNLKAKISEGVGPVVYDAGADILVGSLCDDGRELFYPVLLEMEFEEPVNLFQKVKADRYAYTTAEWLGNSYKVFFNQVASKPAMRGTTKITFLPHIDNDLTLLER